MHGRADQPGGVAVEDDRAVHLAQLAQTGRGELDVDLEAAGGDRIDGLVVAEHDQSAGPPTQNAFESLAQFGAGCHRREGRA
jgi:hypothetical protein